MEQEKEQQQIPRDQIPEGPGYTPQQRDLLPDELVTQAAKMTPAANAPATGTFLNLKTGQVQVVEGNASPPREDDWVFLFPDTWLSLEDIRQIISRLDLQADIPGLAHF